MDELEFHEAANLFPMMSDDEFSELVNDVKENGQIEPVQVKNNLIIDGRNRYKACRQLEIKPETEEWKGRGSIVDYVISKNLKRRNLTSAQKAAISSDALPMLEEEAKERKRQTEGRPKKDEKPTEKIPEVSGESRDQAAKLTGTNPRYVSDAKTIKEKAPDVHEKMKSGGLNMPRAKRLSETPEETRKQIYENEKKEEEGKTKTCYQCGELLPVEKFYKSSICNSCKNKNDVAAGYKSKGKKSEGIGNLADEKVEYKKETALKERNQKPPELTEEEKNAALFDASVDDLFMHLGEIEGFVGRSDSLKEIVKEAVNRDKASMTDFSKTLERVINLINLEVI